MEQDEIQVAESWKPKILILGTLIGALTGLGAALLLLQRADKQGIKPSLGTKEGISLGMLVFGMLRQVAQLVSGDEK